MVLGAVEADDGQGQGVDLGVDGDGHDVGVGPDRRAGPPGPGGGGGLALDDQTQGDEVADERPHGGAVEARRPGQGRPGGRPPSWTSRSSSARLRRRTPSRTWPDDGGRSGLDTPPSCRVMLLGPTYSCSSTNEDHPWHRRPPAQTASPSASGPSATWGRTRSAAPPVRRVAQAAAEQNAALKKLVNSRNELLNYSSNREQEIKQIDSEIAAYNARQREMARQAAIEEAEQEREAAAYARAQANRRSRVASRDDDKPRSTYRSSSSRSRRNSSSSSSTRRSRSRRTASSSSSSRPRQRYRNVQVARRVNRVEYVPSTGGVLKPMSIPEIVFKNERVPVASGSAAGTARDDSARSDSSSSQSKSAGPPPPATDDFPASDP